MLRQITIAIISCLMILAAACSKDDDFPPPPPPPPPVDSTFTISALSYSPDKVPVKLSAPTFSINGTINFAHAKGGVSFLRLTTSLGFDTTLNVLGGATASSGTINGTFILTRPDAPLQFTFQVWLADAAGRESNRLSGTITIAVDDSGLEWGSYTIDILRVFNDIGYYNNQFVSVTNSGSIGTSPDGIHWQQYIQPGNTALRGITWTGTMYVAVGDQGIIYTSPNATTWANHSLPENENFNRFRSVSASETLIVAVGENSVPVGRTDIVTSPDGINWTRNDFSVNRSELRSVTWTGSRFVAVGIGRTAEFAYPMLFTSPDGLSWTDKSDLTRQNNLLYDVIQAGSKTIAVGSGVAAISDNGGVTWTWHAIPQGVAVFSLAWSGKKLAGAGNGIFTSDDGINWLQTVAGSNLMQNFSCIAWGQYKYVAAGKYEQTVMISP
jgi:hypothetical protein